MNKPSLVNPDLVLAGNVKYLLEWNFDIKGILVLHGKSMVLELKFAVVL